MKIKDIMSKNLVFCGIGDSLDTVSKLMKENDVGFVLVIDKNRLCAVITDRDLALNMGSVLRDVCNYKVVSIDEEENTIGGLDVMRKHKIKRLVVTSKNKITGVISLSDIINSDIDSSTILEALREIFYIDRSDEEFDVDIDDFIL